MKQSKSGQLLDEPLMVVNIGLEGFAWELEGQGIKVIHIDWAPPAPTC
jgi:hypothetical protein